MNHPACIQFDYAGHDVRTVADEHGEPRFVAADVCAVLEHTNTTMAVASLDEDEKGLSNVETPGGVQQMLTVSESGLYSLILRSRKPEAKAFKRWVTHEVLPAIRKTGAYNTVAAFDPMNLDHVVQLAELARTQQRQLVEQAPKVEAFESYMDADNAIQMGAAANQLGIGRNTMMRKLREAKVLQRDNRPYQQYAHHFKVVGQTYEATNETRATHTTYVKPSGVELIRRVLSGGRGLVAIQGGEAS